MTNNTQHINEKEYLSYNTFMHVKIVKLNFRFVDIKFYKEY